MARNKHPEITVNRILDVATTLFLEKGYEYTTIQNIINELGDLSKGAIYHHFKSKDDIIRAVCERYYQTNNDYITALLSADHLTGLEKLRQAMKLSLDNPKQEKLLSAMPNLMKNPKFLAEQLYESVEEIAPDLIEPLLRQGNADGSLHVENTQEAAELIMLMVNIWVNPAVFQISYDKLKARISYIEKILNFIGIKDLLDDEIWKGIEKYRNLLYLPGEEE